MTENTLITTTVFYIIVSALTAYRVARMIAYETGPFALFARARRHIDPQQKSWVGVGLNCPYCLGFWCSLISFGLLQYTQNSIVHFLVYVLAIAGIQTIIQSWEPIPSASTEQKDS